MKNKRKIRREKRKIEEETEDTKKHYGVPEEDAGKLTLKEENRSKYHNKVAICGQYREYIIELYNQKDDLMDDHSILTDVGEEERQNEIDSKVSTLKSRWINIKIIVKN